MVNAQVMDRTFTSCSQMEVRQTRRGCLQEILGCEARTEFKYFKDGTQFAQSLEEANFCCRFFCAGINPFVMVIKEEGTSEEVLTMDRPMRCPVGQCKCCCRQEMTFSSGQETMGAIQEEYWYCVPRFSIVDPSGQPIYKLHQPTCVGGMCVQICAEGNPCCGRGCCKVPFHVFPASQENTDNGAPNAGKILKKPKSLLTEALTDANAFDITFPPDASNEQKAMLVGSAVFLNANFFESNNEN